MDRFVWTNGLLDMNETLVIQQSGVRLYDGDEKVFFVDSVDSTESYEMTNMWKILTSQWCKNYN